MDPENVHDMLEVPTHEHIDMFNGCQRDMLGINQMIPMYDLHGDIFICKACRLFSEPNVLDVTLWDSIQLPPNPFRPIKQFRKRNVGDHGSHRASDKGAK
jgi:hypothetical protein